MQPLVSIICLCYNHERFLPEALDSVLAQTYSNIEIIIVDDASTDQSVKIIQDYCFRFPQLKFIQNEKNTGNCRAFNKAFWQSKGEFIIDFATDDVLLPERVEEQVKTFQELDKSYGVVYTNAEFITEDSKPVGVHYQHNSGGRLISFAPSGDVYEAVLRRYFVSTVTMMLRREVFEKMQGYDENLAYEDLDLWVRSARNFKYFYVDKVLTKRRLHPKSLSKSFYQPGSKLLASSIIVFEKAKTLNRTGSENKALSERLRIEIRQAFFAECFPETCKTKSATKKANPLSQKPARKYCRYAFKSSVVPARYLIMPTFIPPFGIVVIMAIKFWKCDNSVMPLGP